LTLDSQQNQQASALADGQVLQALGSAIATVTIVGVGLSLTMTLIALRLAEQGYSAWAIGLNPIAGGFAILAGAAFVPALARRMSVRPLLFIALLTSSLSLLSFALTDNYWASLDIRAVFSGALSVLFVTSEYWINAIAPPRLRGFVLGFYMTSLAGGFAVGPGILGFVGTAGAAPFIVATAFFALAALPIVLWSGKVPEIKSAPPVPVFGFLTSDPAATFAGLCMARSKRRVSAFCPSMPFARS
jgi:MFS family permease